jgi:hypothetical protein
LAQHPDVGDEMFDKGQANIIIELVSQMIYNLKCLDKLKVLNTGHFLTTHVNIYTKGKKV